MKILQVCHRYYPYMGGVEEHIKCISERLARRFDITVCTTDPSNKLLREEIINRVKVKRFRSWAPNEAYYFSRELKQFLIKNANNYDVVHTHNYHAFPALYAAQAKAGHKLVFTPHYHGAGHTFLRSVLHMPYRYIGKKVFEKADRIVCVSRYEKSLVVKNFGVKEDKIVIIPNGVNQEEFRNLKKRKKGYRSVLYVGRLEKYKGVHYLIKVLPMLEGDVILEIVGDGPYKEGLVKLARKLKVENRVMFFENLSRAELLQKYVDADIFVMLSKHEAYCMSVAEALSAGTPCIVANTSALTEWIDGKNCFGIEYPVDLGELKNLIDSVIGKSVKISNIPDWNEVAEKIANLYERC